MCGNETIVRFLTPQALGFIGLGYSVNNPVKAIIASIVLIIIVDRFFVFWEKFTINKITNLRKTIFG